MVFRNLIRRHRERQKWKRRAKLPRVEYLLEISHDMLEGEKEAWDGQNYLELVEQQLRRGEIDLAIGNIGRQPAYCFQIANLYWGEGNLEQAEIYLRKTLERYHRLITACQVHNWPHYPPKHYGEAYIKAAATLLEVKLDGPAPGSVTEIGYQPWFENTLLNYCLGEEDFDLGAWQAGEDKWLANRFPKYKLKEYEVYVKALTGGFASDDEMLKAHEKMFTGRAAKNPQSHMLEGYDDNELIVDYIFAAILKRIGWEGTYRHSWPGTCPLGTPAVTTRASPRPLRVIAPPPLAPDGDTGMIADPQAARRFIDTHVKDQRDHWTNEFHDPARPAGETGKVVKVLKDLGWKADKATLDLLRSYRMDAILNDSTHIMLSDPIGDRYTGLTTWNQLLSEEFGLHPDFIAVAESEEKTDYRDPQGAWHVYWKKDKRIYAVQRDDWGDPKAATTGARPGKEMWPNYLSFVAWWVAQHLAFEDQSNSVVMRDDP